MNRHPSTAPVKPVKATKPPVQPEGASHWLERNHYFTLGLSPVERAALEKCSRLFYPKRKDRSSARTAWVLLRAALAHFEALGPLICDDANLSRKSPGVAPAFCDYASTPYLQGLIARNFGVELPERMKRSTVMQHFGAVIAARPSEKALN